MREITLPETKPALEWVNGRALQKVSPKRKHALAQIQFAAALNAWARSAHAGMVGTEWRFRIAPPDEVRRPLVPDVAFLSYARMPYAAQLETEEPDIAPDVAVEILSPSDRPADIAEKIRVYLASGSAVVALIDPASQSMTIHEGGGSRSLGPDDAFEHAALPGFHLQIAELFTPPPPPRASSIS
ncbi:MAG TPA: Uma2 family endonuclease [Candidatus Eremiobacteraceae bacterium]|nr:Uma2 family endonuclease [Candidatus Eremiobacteraceae bacterium]